MKYLKKKTDQLDYGGTNKMIKMDLTEEERELILAKREKEDLWYLHKSSSEWALLMRSFLYSTSEKEMLIQDMNKCFEFMLPAGTKFYCYVDKNIEHWQGPGPDDVFESMTTSWAEKYLIDIKSYDE